MNGVPVICVDIFSQIANLLDNFNAVSNNPTNTFSHNAGYRPALNVNENVSAASSSGLESNELLAWIVFVAMVVFFITGLRRPQEDLK